MAEEEEGGWAAHGGYGREGAPVTEPWEREVGLQGLNFGSGELNRGLAYGTALHLFLSSLVGCLEHKYLF